MNRRTLAAGLILASGACVSSQNLSIQVPFALLSSDQLQAPQPGQPCTWSPVTQSGGFYLPNGVLELDPNLNPNPDYVLHLQVENYLDQTTITDSNGNTISGPQRNDFMITDAIVEYVPEQSYLETGVAGQKAKFLTSGRVQPGGSQSATAVGTSTISPTIASQLLANLQAVQNPSAGIFSVGGDVVLDVYFEGNLASGEPAITGTFEFPLHVCIDCGSVPSTCAVGSSAPCACAGLAGGTLVPAGHGPCCLPQDFTTQCVSCGYENGPACAEPDGVTFPCNSSGDCAGYGVGLNTCATGGFCVCTADTDCTGAYGAGSKCTANGTCTPGCGTGLCPSALTSVPQGQEFCGYPDSSSLTTTCTAPQSGSAGC